EPTQERSHSDTQKITDRSRPDHNSPSFPTRRSSDLQTILSVNVVGEDDPPTFAGGADLGEGFDQARGYPLARHLHQAERADLERSEEHTSELQSRSDLVCRLLPAKKKNILL